MSISEIFDHCNPSFPTEFKRTEPGEPKLVSNHFNPKLLNPQFPARLSFFPYHERMQQNSSAKLGSRVGRLWHLNNTRFAASLNSTPCENSNGSGPVLVGYHLESLAHLKFKIRHSNTMYKVRFKKHKPLSTRSDSPALMQKNHTRGV